MEIYTPKSLKSENCSRNVFKSENTQNKKEPTLKFESKSKVKKKNTEMQNFMIKFKETIINRLRTFFEFEDSYYSDGS